MEFRAFEIEPSEKIGVGTIVRCGSFPTNEDYLIIKLKTDKVALLSLKTLSIVGQTYADNPLWITREQAEKLLNTPYPDYTMSDFEFIPVDTNKLKTLETRNS